MQTIKAKTNDCLLTKAERLFTGTLQGRMIELLQNARRAGATQVVINNHEGIVSVKDNGSGIKNFQTLLELGRSGWDDRCEAGEDPAGVGMFSLAPRPVTIASRNQKVSIAKWGWTGTPIEIQESTCSIGTELTFPDEHWEFDLVKSNAIFSGMNVIVDGKACGSEAFVSDRAINYLILGYKIEITPRIELSHRHQKWCSITYWDNTLVNFHGQVISFQCALVSQSDLAVLVELTGEPTDIRLMLPARTKLFENPAFEKLKAAIELECYRFIQRQESHRLPFKDYLRAKELGMDLPESEKVFKVGVLDGDSPEPIEMSMPDDFPLAQCYRVNSELRKASDTHEANVHLLAALGTFEPPFVPVTITADYEGYRWAKLPTVDKVIVKAGKKLGQENNWSGNWIAVESLEMSCHTSDGKIFTCKVPMAIVPPECGNSENWGEDVFLTLEAQKHIAASEIWFHQGGFSDEGDTYDTQLAYFEKELDLFWSNILGPGHYLRQQILESLWGLKFDWQKIIVDEDKTITVKMKDGSEKVLK